MRPDFGSGLLNLVFAPAGQSLAAATQLLVQSALHQWLGTLIEVEGVETRYEEGLLEVTVRYVRRSDGERRQVSVARAVP
jgi:phage baseplate assembly protein W